MTDTAQVSRDRQRPQCRSGLVDPELADQLLAKAEAQGVELLGPPPPWVQEAGRAAYTWHTVDAELAHLTYDSAADPAGALARARADPAALRALTFVASGVTIEVEVTAGGLQGHVVPAGPGEVELHLPDGSRYATALDDVGWFLFTRRPDGRFRLQLRLAEGGTALTPWTATP